MRFASRILASLGLVSLAQGVLYGDEAYGNVEGGRFWAFYSGGVAVINPETCSVETDITMDNQGNALPGGWSDGVYMQNVQPQMPSKDGYVMINSRVNRENATGDPVSDVYVFSTTQRKVVSVVEVGPRVVHSYGVHRRNEFWTHSDGDGHLYVIDLNDIATTESRLQSHKSMPSHGKLLWDEDGTLGNRGFTTKTGERFLGEVDLENAELVRSYDYSNDIQVDSGCRGLHAISYSKVNQHIYAECVAGGGILEFDVSGGDVRFVHQHLGATGALYEVDDGSFVVSTNKGGDKLHVFQPNGSGMRSSLTFEVSVPGHPSTPVFYPTDNVAGGADYIACMPLTGNPNSNQIHNGQVKCDFYNGCTGASTLFDVQNGVCLHTPIEDGPDKLMRVNEIVATDDSNDPCARCKDQSNFVDGQCVCTPNCGSCDSEFTPDLSRTGVACVDLGAVVDGTVTSATLIPNAGAVRQGNPYSSSNECTYGRTYRNHKRGQQYDASVSNFPQNSIVIVDMSTQTRKCQVNVNGSPARVVYAPRVPVTVDGVGPTLASSTTGTPGGAVNAASGAASATSVMMGLIMIIAGTVSMA